MNVKKVICQALCLTCIMSFGLKNPAVVKAEEVNSKAQTTLETKNKSPEVKISKVTTEEDGTSVEDTFYTDGSRKITIKSGSKEDVYTYKNGTIEINGVKVDTDKIIKKEVNTSLVKTNNMVPNVTVWRYLTSGTTSFNLAGYTVGAAIAIICFELGAFYDDAKKMLGTWGANILGVSLAVATAVIPGNVSALSDSYAQYLDDDDSTHVREYDTWMYYGSSFSSYYWEFYTSEPV